MAEVRTRVKIHITRRGLHLRPHNGNGRAGIQLALSRMGHAQRAIQICTQSERAALKGRSVFVDKIFAFYAHGKHGSVVGRQFDLDGTVICRSGCLGCRERCHGHEKSKCEKNRCESFHKQSFIKSLRRCVLRHAAAIAVI